jgi:serine protease Do
MAVLAVALAVAALVIAAPLRTTSGDELRRSAMVQAVEKARPAVVNIRGHKTVRSDDSLTAGSREVNGMGTGVVIDPRGYILTNYHVVDGVRQIEVTLADGTTLKGQLVSYDAKTDLAVLKVARSEKMSIITIGTATDLMPAEAVVAVGNAYGYEHTVTRGIISALHRTVQVSDTQSYNDLIQTDASINPGNSGGPLLNITGEMIGLNVAVRAGAQGIGFAIPVDQAMQIAARLMSIERLDRNWHGVTLKSPTPEHTAAVIERVADGSPAQKADLKPGDAIKSIDGQPIHRALDIERVLLGRKAGDQVPVAIERDGNSIDSTIELAARKITVEDRMWDQLGARLASVPAKDVRDRRTQYNGGMKVTEVRADGPAKKQGIRPGDVLVGLHVWETVSPDNVEFVLTRPELIELSPIKFYIVRGGETLVGRIGPDSLN